MSNLGFKQKTIAQAAHQHIKGEVVSDLKKSSKADSSGMLQPLYLAWYLYNDYI